ncbi:C-type lectin domain family 4 member E isoform X2 [Cololabis saira]|uniref:C-type lectin domain family 4 member E isoform X2 n=1 Tax=Cololabis saira TaxID=129043 RepID=UPI002AD37F22|nr:C-type lectin domain family 4 member E isoform X2 [Cololabis saira]
MYIKFFRTYVEDKKDEASENLSSKLSVELEGKKGKQDEGNTRLYRAACLFLSIVCLVLLLVIIVLGVKLQTGSSLCSEGKETPAVDRNNLPPTCSLEECQHQFPNIQYKSKGCQQCAPGWVPYGRSCYFLSTFRLSWADSQRNCSSSGGSLAVITSQDVQDFLTTKGNLMYWIGLKHTDSNWNWVDKSPLQKSYWTDASAGGDCALLNTESRSKKNWIRANCQSSTYFICHLQM